MSTPWTLQKNRTEGWGRGGGIHATWVSIMPVAMRANLVRHKASVFHHIMAWEPMLCASVYDSHVTAVAHQKSGILLEVFNWNTVSSEVIDDE